eukprot:SAG31_NODE_8667_length_1410_cov_1.544622_2_plen_57_part_00
MHKPNLRYLGTSRSLKLGDLITGDLITECVLNLGDQFQASQSTVSSTVILKNPFYT